LRVSLIAYVPFRSLALIRLYIDIMMRGLDLLAYHLMFDPVYEAVVEFPDYARFWHHGLVFVDVEFRLLPKYLRVLHEVVHVKPEDTPQLLCVLTGLWQLEVHTDQLWDGDVPIPVVIKHLEVDSACLVDVALEGNDEATDEVRKLYFQIQKTVTEIHVEHIYHMRVVLSCIEKLQTCL
jgi:hypothetical protein